MFKITTKPKIQLRLKYDYKLLGKFYKKGAIFTVINSDGIRGYDVRDEDGKEIYELGLSMEVFDVIRL